MTQNDDFSAEAVPSRNERPNEGQLRDANGYARRAEPSVCSANVTPPSNPGGEPQRQAALSPTSVVEVRELRIADLDRSIHARAKLDLAHVEQFVKLLADGHELPPVDVVWDPVTQRYYLAGGYHRTAAHEKLGRETILARVQVGTRRDAILFGVGQDQNKSRSNADKRKSVELLLGDPEWRKWSNVVIGRHCGVDDKTVASVREQLGLVADRTRRTANGHEMQTRRIGRRKATSEVPKSIRPTGQTGLPGDGDSTRKIEYRPPACPLGWSWVFEDGRLVGIANVGEETAVSIVANDLAIAPQAVCPLDSLDFDETSEPSTSATEYLTRCASGIDRLSRLRLPPGTNATDVFPSINGVPICTSLKDSIATSTRLLESLGFRRVGDGEKPPAFADVIVIYGDESNISHVAIATTGTPRQLRSIVSVAPEIDGELVTHSKGKPTQIWAKKSVGK